MNKWDVICINERKDFQCQNCGEVKWGTFATLRHYRWFRYLDGVCKICLKEDFNWTIKREVEYLEDLKWLYLKYKEEGSLRLWDFYDELIKYLVKKCQGNKDWKPGYENALKDDYLSKRLNEIGNSVDADYIIEKFFIPYIEFQGSLGEW